MKERIFSWWWADKNPLKGSTLHNICSVSACHVTIWFLDSSVRRMQSIQMDPTICLSFLFVHLFCEPTIESPVILLISRCVFYMKMGKILFQSMYASGSMIWNFLLLLTISSVFGNPRKDSEQTKQIEELQKQNDELTEEKERLLEEIERIIGQTGHMWDLILLLPSSLSSTRHIQSFTIAPEMAQNSTLGNRPMYI